jgi:hypothetical protein
LSVWYERISKEEDATKVWPELLGWWKLHRLAWNRWQWIQSRKEELCVGYDVLETGLDTQVELFRGQLGIWVCSLRESFEIKIHKWGHWILMVLTVMTRWDHQRRES